MEVRLPSRTNGLSCPPHPLQFLVIAVLIYFSLIWYCVNVPALPTVWQPAGYTILAVVLIAHVVTYAVATVINPADDNVLTKAKKGTSAKLDRSVHKHAIENEYCYLCECSVGPKSKHCSTCNKCIEDFDHHCMWLNNCVGGKNYRTFLTCLLSGMLGTTLIASINLMQFIAYYTDKERGDILLPYYLAVKEPQVVTTPTQDNSTVLAEAQFHVFFTPAKFEVFLFFTFFTAVLALIALILLGHLFFFHVYLMCRGVSTYEHIVRQRQREEEMARNTETDLDVERDIQTTTSASCLKSIRPSRGAVNPASVADDYPTKEKTQHTLV